MSTSLNKRISEFKLVLLGMSGVGKTSMIVRFTKDTFNEYQSSTTGVAHLTKTICVRGTTIQLNIWDTAGQERFHSLVSMYYRNSQAALVVYDIQNWDSFHRARVWVSSLQRQNPPVKVIALAANKSEPVNHHVVEIEEVKKYAEKNNLIFMETSAQTGLNIKEIFLAIGEKLADADLCKGVNTNDAGLKLRDENSQQRRNSFLNCC